MQFAFTATTPLTFNKTLHSARSRPPSCSLDPSKPVEPTRNLSSTDRQYLSKIKARFFNARQRAAAAHGEDYESLTGEHEDCDVPVIPDDLDKMDDVLFDRGPENEGQAKLFGGWLDEAVAGRKANDSSITSTSTFTQKQKARLSSVKHSNRQQKVTESTAAAIQEADAAFAKAMNVFGRGMYPEASSLFAKAVQVIGEGSRLGGQYQLWQGQALDAAGNKKAAVALFNGLRKHRDSEVRKVARELLFIVTAPKLELDKTSFLEIPDIDEAKSALTSSLLNLSNFNTMRVSVFEKPPEPHSLQWYLDKEKPQKVEDHSGMQAAAVVGAILGTLIYMAASAPPPM